MQTLQGPHSKVSTAAPTFLLASSTIISGISFYPICNICYSRFCFTAGLPDMAVWTEHVGLIGELLTWAPVWTAYPGQPPTYRRYTTNWTYAVVCQTPRALYTLPGQSTLILTFLLFVHTFIFLPLVLTFLSVPPLQS